MSKEKPKLHFQRFEFKYYLPKNTADKLIPALLNHMDWDPYIVAASTSGSGSGQDFYSVNSLYFDSPDLGCFWDKESGVGNRKKMRFRFYEDVKDKSPVYLEIKRKKDALVIKDRIKLSAQDGSNNNLDRHLSLLTKENTDDEFLKELIWFKRRNSMKPKLFISYKRKALVGKKDKKFRVTFDYDIKTQLMSDLGKPTSRLKEVYPGGVVLELKYNNVLPVWFHQIIQKFQLERLSYSKYCNSLRQVMPQLDDNNYSLS